jgi:UDP-galactose transporter B1
MGRQKQATPLRREVSSEYTSAADRTPRHLARGSDENGKNVTLNGHANGKAASGVALVERKQAGLPQLIVAVGGIYASL